MKQNDQKTSLLKVGIIGGSGKTGKLLLEGALQKGYMVQALGRNPDKFQSHDRLTVIKGDVSDIAAIKQLIEGVDVVFSCLGTTQKPHYIVEKGIKNLIDTIAAQTQKPKLVHMSAVGIGCSKPQCMKSLVWAMVVKIAIPLIGSEVFMDMERAEDIILQTAGIKFVIARAAVLNDKPAKGYLALKYDEPVGKLMVSRQDVANFMLVSATDNGWDGTAVSIFSQ